MARHRIVCTEQEPAEQPPNHAHIIAVGIGNDTNKADKRLSLAQVLLALDKGDTFYTKGEQTGKTAEVESYDCSYCRKRFIRSTPDATTDNNLDSLRRCRTFGKA